MNAPQTNTLPSFLSNPNKDLFIDGKWLPAAAGERIDTFNPATGRVLATLARGRQADVDAAVVAARRAFEGPWSRFSPAQRQQVLVRFAELVDKHYDELTLLESHDMGAPLARLRGSKDNYIRNILYYSAQARNLNGETMPNSLPGSVTTMILKAPVGVVGGILPWNGPMSSQMYVIGPVLATGCTAVIKPADEGSLSILRTAELLIEAGLPGCGQCGHRPGGGSRRCAGRAPGRQSHCVHRLDRDRPRDHQSFGRQHEAYPARAGRQVARHRVCRC